MPGKLIQDITGKNCEVLKRIEVEGMEFVKLGNPDGPLPKDAYYLVNGNDMTLTRGFNEIWVPEEGTVVGRKNHKNYEIKSDGTIDGEYHPGSDYFDAKEIHD